MRSLIFPLNLMILLLLVSACGSTGKSRKEADTHYVLGVSYLREGNPTLALRELIQAEQKNPGKAEIQNSIAQAYQAKRAFSDAERHYRKAIRIDGENPQYQNNLAALYLDLERWDDAIRHFRKAADSLIFSTPEISLTGICYANYQKGDLLAAVTACKEAIDQNSRYSHAHLRLGEAYYALNKTALAIDSYREAIVISPDYVLAHYRLGQAYMKLQKPQQAIASFREVLRLAPDSEMGRSVVEYIKILK